MSVSGEHGEPAELDRLRARVAELETALAEQHAATAKAEKDHQFWRRVVEAAPEFISVLDDDFRYFYVNYGAPDYDNVELRGLSLFQFLAPESAAAARAAIEEALATGQPTQYEACDIKMRYWYSNHVRRLDLRDGKPYVVIVTHSIDARRRTELELRNARELWDSLVTNSPDTILLLDREAKIHFINRVAPGYRPEEVVGAHGQDFVLPKYREPLREAIRAVTDTARPQYFEMQDQVNAMWWAVTLVPVRNDHRVDLVLAISSDVTERRRSEESLRESEASLRMLLAQVPALLWTIDNDQRILSVDGLGLQSLGLTNADWQGKTLSEVFHTADPTFVPLAAHRAALLGKSVAYEQLLATSDYQMHVEPLRDHAGNIVGALGVGIDVTSRKASEEEVRRANDELERRVAARTSELDRVNKSLREDIDKRELAERALRESEERFRIIAETVPVAVIITRQSDGLIMFANRRTGELVEIPHPQLLGRHSSEFYADPSERADIVAQLQAGAGMVDRVLRVKRSGDQDVYVSVSYQPIVFAGEPAILTGFVDISKRMETEQLLRHERRFLKRLLELHERDRQLIAYEIHDGVVQDMTASLMFLESSRADDVAPDEAAREAFANGLRLLRGSIHETRRLINGLRPPVLEDEGVIPAIEALVAEVEDNAGMKIDFDSDVKFRRLAPALEMAIYRIVQEGLNNVWHHSRSARARVELIQRDDAVEILVQDWGIGFDPSKVAKRRYGLMGVRERARLLNGRAEIQSVLGEGTSVKVELPLIDALMPTAE